jgi:hypothetical protein
MYQQLLPHVPAEVKERIQMDYEVNKLDPDFDFYKAVFGKEPSAYQPLSL